MSFFLGLALFSASNVRVASIALELALVLVASVLYFHSAPRTPLGLAATASVLGSGLITLGLNALGY
jgi:hypothetical protein